MGWYLEGTFVNLGYPGPGGYFLKKRGLECVDLAEISILPVLFLQNLDSRIGFVLKSSETLQIRNPGDFCPISGPPPKPDPSQKLDLGLEFEFQVPMRRNLPSCTKK